MQTHPQQHSKIESQPKAEPQAHVPHKAVSPVASAKPSRPAVKAINSDDSESWVSEMSSQAQHMDKTVQSFLRKRPIAAVMAAVCIGFVGSMITKRFT